MSICLFDGQIPKYVSEDGTKSIQINAGENSIIISDTGLNKVLRINSIELANNSGQSLLFQDIYKTVNKTLAITYPSDSSSTLNISDNLIVSPVGGGQDNAQLTNSSLIINRTSGQTLQLINDTSSPYVVPTLLLQNNVGEEVSFRFNELNCSGTKTFILNNNTRFFKQMNPFSFLVTELATGGTILKSMAFVFIQPIAPSDYLQLETPIDYLDDSNMPGWSCIVSNYSSNTLQITTNGIRYYSHSSNLGNDPIIITKWTTARLTLVYSNSDFEYLWAVSQF